MNRFRFEPRNTGIALEIARKQDFCHSVCKLRMPLPRSVYIELPVLLLFLLLRTLSLDVEDAVSYLCTLLCIQKEIYHA